MRAGGHRGETSLSQKASAPPGIPVGHSNAMSRSVIVAFVCNMA
jgi:hypothetical protein